MASKLSTIIRIIGADEVRRRQAVRLLEHKGDYDEWYESGRWYCKESPNNGHSWYHVYKEVWKCKYCKCYKLFPMTFDSAVKYGHLDKYKTIFPDKSVKLTAILLEEGV